VWRRIGAVFFAGTGQVASEPDAFHRDGFHTAAGFGFRFVLSRSEELNLRFDFGFSEDGGGFYVGLGEAF
jgi:hypothetical protein